MTWRERIVAAEKRRRFVKRDRDGAESWQTCAVGEQHAMHPEVVVYTTEEEWWGGKIPAHPRDIKLDTLGKDFAWRVDADDVAAAAITLDAIEDRVLQLKRGAA